MKKLFLFLTLLLTCSSFAAISRTGTVSVTATSGTFSATATGDLKVVVAFRNGSTSAPTLPGGWTQVGSAQTGTTSSFIVGCNVSSSSGDTSTGTWTNATQIAGVSYSGAATTTTGNCHFDAIGVFNYVSGTSTSETYSLSGGNPRQANGSSWILGVSMDKTTTNCTATGLTAIGTNTGTGPAILLNDTNGGVSTWNDPSCTVTSSTWLTATIEIAARTCSNTPISGTNLSCMQASGILGWSTCGSAVSSLFTPLQAGDTVYLYSDGDAQITAISDQVDGSYTPVFAETSWNAPTFTGIWKIVVSNTTARNVTPSCSGMTGSEVWILEWHSSVGTVTEDCKSSILTGAPLTNPAPGCTPTKPGDVAVAYMDWGSNAPRGGSGMTTVSEGMENVWQYKALPTAAAFTAPWAFSDTGITGAMALSDGAPTGISRTGSCAAASTSCTLSAVKTGDLKLVYAFRNGSTTAPTLPASWNSVSTGSGTSVSYQIGCAVASSGADTGTGTWTNATDVVAVAYNHTSAQSPGLTCAEVSGGLPGAGVGTFASSNGTTSTVTYPTISLEDSILHNSWVVGFAGQSAGTGCTPTGMSSIATAGTGPSAIVNDTAGKASSWSSTNCTGSAANWISATVEILNPPCQNTAYGNITCVQVRPLGGGACTGGGGVISISVVAGDRLLAWQDLAAVGDGATPPVDGVNTWTQVGTEGAWNTSGTPTVWERIYTTVASTSTTLSVNPGCPNGGEFVVMNLRSSVGTVAVDCTSNWTAFDANITSGSTMTTSCSSTKTNEIGISFVDWGAVNPNPNLPWLRGTADTEDITAFKFLPSAGTVTGSWAGAPTDSYAVNTIALSDGGSVSGPPPNQYFRLQY